MPFIGEVKRTYSRKADKANFGAAAHQKNVNNVIVKPKKASGSKNSTLDDSFWKDSFDKLLEDKR